MSYFDMQTSQQQPQQNWAMGLPNPGQFLGGWAGAAPSNAAFGLPAYGQMGQMFGQSGFGTWGPQQGWGAPQRQLSQYDVGEIVRQLLPMLPQIIAQAQQPQAAFGHTAFGYGGFGQTRTLTPQDVNDVVRQILPILPQVVGMLQGQGYQQQGGPLGGMQPLGAFGHGNYGQQAPFQAAFGNVQPRQPSQHDIGEIVRQLASFMPQASGPFQPSQQRMI